MTTNTNKTYKGHTSVRSPWSDGYRQTKFTISVSKDGMVKITPARGSRIPDFNDVWESLEDFLLDELEMELGSTPPSGMEKKETSFGAHYVGLNGHFIGRSPEGKFSFRGKDEIPLETLRVLLYPLDDYLREVDI